MKPVETSMSLTTYIICLSLIVLTLPNISNSHYIKLVATQNVIKPACSHQSDYTSKEEIVVYFMIAMEPPVLTSFCSAVIFLQTLDLVHTHQNVRHATKLHAATRNV